MFTIEEVSELRNSLPFRGIQTISNRTGVSRPTIYSFLKGHDVGLDNAEKIWEEGWSIVREYKEKRAKLIKHAEEIKNIKV